MAGRSHRQHDLADVQARLHAGMGLECLGQRECGVDHGLDLARGDERPDPLLDAAGDRGLLGDGARRSVEPV